jgi:hypothetical protein
MQVRLINTDNDEVVDLLHTEGDLTFDDDGSAEFEDLAFVVADRERDEDILVLHSPWHFYKFAVV